jgi:hypothetical protein
MSYFGTSSLDYVNQEIESALSFYNGFIETLENVAESGSVYAYNLPLNGGKDELGQESPHLFLLAGISLLGGNYTGIDFADAEQVFINNFINLNNRIDFNISAFKANIIGTSIDQFGLGYLVPLSIDSGNIPSTLTENSPLLDVQKAFKFIEKCDIERRTRINDYIVKYNVTNKRVQIGTNPNAPEQTGLPMLLGDIASGQVIKLFEGGEYEKYYDTQRVDSPISPSSPSVTSYQAPTLSPFDPSSPPSIEYYKGNIIHKGLFANTGFSSEVGTTHFLAEAHADNDVLFFRPDNTTKFIGNYLRATTGVNVRYSGQAQDEDPFVRRSRDPRIAVRQGNDRTSVYIYSGYDYRQYTNNYLYYPTQVISALQARDGRIDELKRAIDLNEYEEDLALSTTSVFIDYHSGIIQEWNELAEESFDTSETVTVNCDNRGTITPTSYTVQSKTRTLRASNWSTQFLFGIGFTSGQITFESLGLENYINTYKRFGTGLLYDDIRGLHTFSDDAVRQDYFNGFLPIGCVDASFHLLQLNYGRIYSSHDSPYTKEVGPFSPSQDFVTELKSLSGEIPQYFKNLRTGLQAELIELSGQTIDASILKGPDGNADSSLKVGFLRTFTTSVRPRSTESFESHINDDIARIVSTGYKDKIPLRTPFDPFNVQRVTGYRYEHPLSGYSYSIYGYQKSNLNDRTSNYNIDVLFYSDYDGTKGGEIFTSVNGASSQYAKKTALCRNLEAIRLQVQDSDLYYYNGLNPNSGTISFFRPTNFMGIGAYESTQPKGYRTSHFYQNQFNENSFKYELNSYNYERNSEGRTFDYVKKIIPNPFNVYPSKVNGEWPLVPVGSGFSKTGASNGSGYYFVESPKTPLLGGDSIRSSQPTHKSFWYQNLGPSGAGSGSGFYFTKLYQTGSGVTYVYDALGNIVTGTREWELLINPYPRVNTYSPLDILYVSDNYENWFDTENLYADYYYDSRLRSLVGLRDPVYNYQFLNRTLLTAQIDHSSSYLNGYVNYNNADLSYSDTIRTANPYSFTGPNDSKNEWNLHKHYTNVNCFGAKSFYTQNQETKEHSGTVFHNIFPNQYNKQVSADIPVYPDYNFASNPLIVSSLTKTSLTWIDLASTLESEAHYLNTDCKLWHPYAMDTYVHIGRSNSFTGQLNVEYGQYINTFDLPGYPKFNVEIYTGENLTSSSKTGIQAKEVAVNTFDDFYWRQKYYEGEFAEEVGIDARYYYISTGLFRGSDLFNNSSIINKSSTRSVMVESVPNARNDSPASIYGGPTYNSKDDYVLLSPVNAENFPRRINDEVLSEERSLTNGQKVKVSYQAFHYNPISVRVKLKWGYDMHEQASGERPVNLISGGEEDITSKLAAAGYDLSLGASQDYKIVNLNMPKLFGNPISVFHLNPNDGSFGNYRRNFSPDQNDIVNFKQKYVPASPPYYTPVDVQFEGFGYADRQKIDGSFYHRKRYQINPHYRLEFEGFTPHFDQNNFGKKSFGDPDASDYHENLKTGCTISIERKYPAINRDRYGSTFPVLYDVFGNPFNLRDVYKNMYYPVLETNFPVWSQLNPNYEVEASTYKKSNLALSQFWKDSSHLGINETYGLFNGYLFEPREVVLAAPFDYGNRYLTLSSGVNPF